MIARRRHGSQGNGGIPAGADRLDRAARQIAFQRHVGTGPTDVTPVRQRCILPLPMRHFARLLRRVPSARSAPGSADE